MTNDPHPYLEAAPARAEIDAGIGTRVLDFGTNWCGICKAARPHIDAAFAAHAGVRHTKVEDGPGRALGRSFGVKLWPTLIFLRDGREVARLVRPQDEASIAQALLSLAGSA